MYNSKFILNDGREVYPGYLDTAGKEQLKEEFGNNREYMRCGCKPSEELFYRISNDLKIYPEHNNYVHDRFCSRFKDTHNLRQTAYMINEEDGNVTAYVTFNPKELSSDEPTDKEEDNEVPEESDQEIMEEVTIEQESDSDTPSQAKEPKLSLGGLIRSLNVDSFTERVLNNSKIVSRETFSKFVYHRINRIKLNKLRKSLGELTLEKDGVRFIYLPFAGIIDEETNGARRCYIQTRNQASIYKNYIYPDTMEKSLKVFRKSYGIEPDENTMIAGFQYLKKTRSHSAYRVLGRIHLFQISNNGICSRSILELDTFNSLSAICAADSSIKFYIPPEDESIGAIIEVKGSAKKVLLCFRSKKAERITYDTSIYSLLVVDKSNPLTKDLIYAALHD